MKKILLVAGIAGMSFLLSCKDEKKGAATTTTTENATTTTTYTASEGDVTYKGGKLMVYRNNAWVDADDDITVDNGIVVRKTGHVVKDNDEYELEDGVVVTKTGNFFDKAGNAIENGWEGVKKAFRNVKAEVKDALTPDNKEKNQN
jgi:hypothetical protein